MTNEKFLEVNNLTVEYTSGGQTIHAVNGVSFSLEKGKTLALVGETGAGKTTIAKSILRILPNPQGKIKTGEIKLNGNDLLKVSEKEMQKIRGKQISMVFQDPMTALNPTIKVGEQIEEVLTKHYEKEKDKSPHEAAIEMLELVGIHHTRFNEYPHQFSGGMKQRVVIAMALACNPELLLADEPTTALDVTIQAQVLDMIADLKKRYNTSMILITHDLGVVAKVADTVAVTYAGQIVEYGTKEEVYLHPSHPYTIGLFGAIPDIHSNAKRLTNIEGLPPDPTNLPTGCYFHPRCPYAGELCHTQQTEMIELRLGHCVRCSQLDKVHTGGNYG